MNDNAKAWVAALRSGKYKQGTGQLHGADATFCCLGVACDLFAQNNPINITEDSGGFSYNESGGLLPDVVQAWLGLETMEGLMADARALFAMNDTGTTFEEIANVIEAEPAGLFV